MWGCEAYLRASTWGVGVLSRERFFETEICLLRHLNIKKKILGIKNCLLILT
jgi:hypothetical protein